MKNAADLFTLPVTETAYSYADYMLLMEKVVLESSTTGPKQSEELNYYTKLNLSRMQRLNKKANPVKPYMEFAEDIQRWYISDKSESVQRELTAILEAVSIEK